MQYINGFIGDGNITEKCWHLATLCVGRDDSPSYEKLYDYNDKDQRLEVEYKLKELKEYHKTFGVSI